MAIDNSAVTSPARTATITSNILNNNPESFLTTLYNFFTPSNVKEMLMIIILIICMYFIYENRQLYLDTKTQCNTYEKKLREIVNDPSNCSLEDVKKYFESKDIKNKAEENIQKFINNTNTNATIIDKKEYFR